MYKISYDKQENKYTMDFDANDDIQVLYKIEGIFRRSDYVSKRFMNKKVVNGLPVHSVEFRKYTGPNTFGDKPDIIDGEVTDCTNDYHRFMKNNPGADDLDWFLDFAKRYHPIKKLSKDEDKENG